MWNVCVVSTSCLPPPPPDACCGLNLQNLAGGSASVSPREFKI